MPLPIFATWRARNPDNGNFAQKLILGPQCKFVADSDFDAKSGFLSKNAFLSSHVADAYKPNGILTKKDAFSAQSRFWIQNRVSDTQNRFWAKSAFSAKVTKKV